MSTATSAKVCVACGADLTHIPRMKDSDGRYWCVACGKADLVHQKLRKASMLGSGAACAGCGEHFPQPQLVKFAGQLFCRKCVKSRNRQKGLFGRLFGLFGATKH